MFGVGSEVLVDLMACRSGLPTFPISHAMHSVIQAHLASEVPHWTLWAGSGEGVGVGSGNGSQRPPRLVQRRRLGGN